MRTVMDKAQAMCLEACILQSWWEFAVLHATHCYNRTPIRHLKWATPYSALNGCIPDISHLRVFGCAAYVHIPKEMRINVFSPKSELMVYLGHTEGIKAYTFMRISNNTVYTSTTALFDETLFPKCNTSRTRKPHALESPLIINHLSTLQKTPLLVTLTTLSHLQRKARCPCLTRLLQPLMRNLHVIQHLLLLQRQNLYHLEGLRD